MEKRTGEMLTATDGQAALKPMPRKVPVDLLATNAIMPRLSGAELIAHLRAGPARIGLPVLMLTARADDAHGQATLKMGGDG